MTIQHKPLPSGPRHSCREIPNLECYVLVKQRLINQMAAVGRACTRVLTEEVKGHLWQCRGFDSVNFNDHLCSSEATKDPKAVINISRNPPLETV